MTYDKYFTSLRLLGEVWHAPSAGLWRCEFQLLLASRGVLL